MSIDEMPKSTNFWHFLRNVLNFLSMSDSNSEACVRGSAVSTKTIEQSNPAALLSLDSHLDICPKIINNQHVERHLKESYY